MPNTEVKLLSVDGSRLRSARVERCQAVLNRRISSAGRASALQAEGRRFEPVILHHLFTYCRPSSIGRATDL